jgi:hypothetical protein
MIGDLAHAGTVRRAGLRGGSDDDPALGRQVRRRFLDAHAETDHLVLTAHFPSPSIDIRRQANAFRFPHVD